MAARVRAAVATDAAAIAQVHFEAWQESSSRLVPRAVNARLTVAERKRQWREVLANPDTVAYVAEEGDELVGAAAALPGDPAQLQALYVRPADWNSGAGKVLHDAALARLAELGATRAVLRVLAGNRRARRFYEREGWVFEDVTMDGRGVEAAGYRRSL